MSWANFLNINDFEVYYLDKYLLTILESYIDVSSKDNYATFELVHNMIRFLNLLKKKVHKKIILQHGLLDPKWSFKETHYMSNNGTYSQIRHLLCVLFDVEARHLCQAKPF